MNNRSNRIMILTYSHTQNLEMPSHLKNDLAVSIRHVKDKISECTYVCMYFDFETKPTLRLLWQRWVVPIKNEIIFQIQAPTDVRFIMEDESKKTWDRENICKRTIYSLWFGFLVTKLAKIATIKFLINNIPIVALYWIHHSILISVLEQLTIDCQLSDLLDATIYQTIHRS